jgi:sec-independent protein translocase protein TatA
MGGLRGQEILIIVILLILVFGWKRLPDAARSLGRSARVFKSEVEEMKKDGKAEGADDTVQGQSADHRPAPLVSPPPAQAYQPRPKPFRSSRSTSSLPSRPPPARAPAPTTRPAPWPDPTTR